MERLWEINEEKTQDHWLEVQDPEGWRSAVVRFDGCIHYYRYYNEPFSKRDVDYLHICSIDDEIERLTALRKEAIEFFGEDWDA